MKRLALVALGGILGSFARYLLSESLPPYPLAIIIANAIGVLIAGIAAYRLSPSESLEAFLIPGVAGGMTTFSSVSLIHAQSNSIYAVTYFYGQIALSLAILFLCRSKVAR